MLKKFVRRLLLMASDTIGKMAPDSQDLVGLCGASPSGNAGYTTTEFGASPP